MTSNHRSTPGTMLARGAGVALWRRIERILATGIADPATRFANVPELLRRTGSITKSMAGFHMIDYLRKRSLTGGGSHAHRPVRRSNVECQRPVFLRENVEFARQRPPVQYRFAHFAVHRAQSMVEHDL